MIARVTLTGTYHGQTCQNVFHMFRDNATTAELQDLPAMLIADWINLIRPQQINTFKWIDVMVQQLSPNFGQAIRVAINHPGAIGGSSGLPSVLSVILSFRTGTPGKTGRGRVYISGLKADAFADNVLTPDYLNLWTTIANSLDERWAFGGTFPWRLGIAPRSDPTAFKNVTLITPRAVFGVQRRRNTGVGI